MSIAQIELTQTTSLDLNKIRYGYIWLADLPDIGTSVMRGERPVILVSNNTANRFAPVISVLPITSKNPKLPTHVKLDQNDGLKNECIAQAEQFLTIPRDCLIRPIIKLNYATMLKIDKAINIQKMMPQFEYY